MTTPAAILKDGAEVSNVIASQKVHEAYGGVVPELVSWAHQQNIILVAQAETSRSSQKMKCKCSGLPEVPDYWAPPCGNVLAKGFAIAKQIPMIMNHLQAHILANFIKEPGGIPVTRNSCS